LQAAIQVEKNLRAEFENRKFENVFSSKATTREGLDKWRLRLDSAHQIGEETPFDRVLIRVARHRKRGEKVGGEF